MSSTAQRPWLKLVMVVGGSAFLGLSILPFVDSFLPKSTTPTPTPQSEQVSEAKGFELVLQKDPDNVYALRSLLEIRLRQQDLQGALPLLTRLAKNNPTIGEYHILLAQTQVELGNQEAAVTTYREFLQRQPDNLLALVGITDLLMQLQRPALAESIVQQSLVKVKPGQADMAGMQIQMARLYLAQGKIAPALALLEQLIQQNPQDFRPVFAKAQTLTALGKPQEAQPLFAKAAELAPPEHRDEIKRLTAVATQPSPSPSPGNPSPKSP
ncbi:Tetratricopeptide repeat-containing protein [Gloeomargarita lithophora Alchichica-D10]|uniref:Tetratricopeptide repeat-containing protein n=1 Tax=Gloeomargarita lithophora Alchichica-D10 TaxID=1188229 RepID=A0A1J0AAS4_9CYAN|nr:tetratricopeptide repeat protein [Gloeomargarita lithophora]APB33036.1 Tetratricopeptide repeat-containing protein [Gloeomargarita lithophora Alchichica-D10]